MANPRVTNLRIKNFGCIGESGVSIDIDKIVVLIGPNNAGKSTVLRAFEVVTECSKLDQDDFFNREIVPERLPEIELTSVAIDENKPGDEWCARNADGSYTVREKWTWSGAGVDPKRVGYNVPQNRWAQAGDPETMPWGVNSVAKARRPKPHRVNTFDDADSQSRAVISLLKTLLETNLRRLKANEADAQSRYDAIVQSLQVLRADSKRQQQGEVTALQASANQLLQRVFPHATFSIVAPEGESEVSIDLLGDEFDVRVADFGSVSLPLARQGSGTRRTVLWTILKLLADKGFKARAAGGKAKAHHEPVGPNSAHVLLLDEPEVSLHPRAIDSVRNVLYALPDSDNWQIMVTTHSPNFVDLTRDHTTIIRVDRVGGNAVRATTLYRPEQAQLSPDDKENLKLRNLFDSHISEAFFGGRVLVVEGDTEYSAFSLVKAKERERGNDVYADLSIIRARGKVTIASMMKVLNHFGSPYSVLHDSDRPRITAKRKDKASSTNGNVVYKIVEMANPAWTNNEKIREQMTEQSHVVASLGNFESAYLDEIAETEKPEHAVSRMTADPDLYDLVKSLLDSVLRVPGARLPPGAVAWSTIDELERELSSFDATTSVLPP